MAKKLVDLKRTPAEKKAENARFDKPGGGGDDYGYGLRVRLDHRHLKKLGIEQLPKAGDKLHLHARAHVSSVEQNSREGHEHRSVELELRHMALEGKGGKAAESEEEAHEGKMKGARAVLDKALDAKEEDD